jgi:tetratricopeptide (TPR) repeat protein
MLDVHPSYAQTLIRRGVLDLNSGRVAEGLKSLDEAVRVAPEYGLSRLVLASFYNDLHRYGEALALMSKAPPVLPQLWQSHFQTARALYGTEDYAGALREVTEALRLTSDQATADDRAFLHYLRAGLLLQTGNSAGAKEEFELTLKEDPEGDLGSSSRDVLDTLEAPRR